MISDELCEKLSNYLKEHGYKYDFYLEDKYKASTLTDKYSSFVLKSITGLITNSIIQADTEHSTYNIDLINKLTTILIDSKDDDLINIAWNSFIECVYDERFILFNEMKKAREVYFQKNNKFNSNHTKSMETERLIVEPNCKADSEELVNYIDEYDKEEYLFSRQIKRYSSIDSLIFILKKKHDEALVGSIGLSIIEDERDSFNFSYYVKKEHRRNGYIKEAFKKILEAIVNSEIIMYGEFKREYILDEIKPDINNLIAYCDKDNIASFNTAKSLGFKYDGLYKGNHYFHLKIK